MANWRNNPLFRRAEAAIATKARAEFRGTALGRLANELGRLHPGTSAGAGRRDDFERLIADAARRRLIPGLDPAAVERKLSQVTRYSLSDYALDALFDALGPIGGILKDLLKTTRPGREAARDRDLEAAINFLGSLGFEVIAPPGRRTPSTRQQNIAAALLEAAGWTVTAPGRGPAGIRRPRRDRPR
ncbi:MAG: hypothetical protein K2Y37_14830, partial [Pirellulales bacterium]|nr:hypothetical protein [Pirellulales bacterium]